ncbi:hypothetical protein TSUD_275490 [Trifolium subterraneum]|uniref:non-specific serine/threonine protein kinase n=1 Tax=Trifolium subterraneum TaxID=3900 RepID=A0A2Z6P518_TRISU|nr:hypothetical protein TSUD_275490 [Trifolium subterraneum]
MTILHATLVITKLLLVFFSKFSSAGDTITKSESFFDGSTLISKDGTFELGFFNPGNSPNRYVGIWYKNIPVKTVVWVANRDNPIKDNSSKLKINREGNLVLLNNNQSILWSTNATKTASIPIVHLLNNGNLVLRDDNEIEEDSFLWQSFDYPGNTLLPGMKIGWDKKTGLNRRVIAWNNWEDPSSGYFSSTTKLTCNPEVVIWKGSDEFYRTGPMIGAMSGGVFGLRPNPLFKFYFVNNTEEVYYMYTLKNNSVISIIVLNQTLLVRQRLTWIPESKTWNDYLNLPQDICDDYNVCGTNGKCNIDGSPICQCLDGFKPKSPEQWNTMDWTQGCVRSGNWTCGVKSRDGFLRVAGVKLPDTTNSWINVNMTIDDCKVKCLQNCSCTAYSSLVPNEERKGCSIWFNDLKDLRLSQSGRDLYVRIDASEIDDKHRRTKLIILAASIIIFAIIVMLFTLSIYTTKIKHKEERKNTPFMEDNNEGEHDDLELPFFNITTISDATNNFSIDSKLGEGGFGPVYKGMLQDGQEIAVKRLSRSSGQGLKEFKNEVILCAKLQHRNLVKVIGCCIENDEKMLVYEYMSNTSLDSFLFDVFSFGVLLLELISGKRNRTLPYDRYDHNLIGHAWRLWKEGIAHTLVDDNLKDTCIINEALRCIQIGLLCLQQHPDDRPNMTSVVVMLSSNNVLPQPHEPGNKEKSDQKVKSWFVTEKSGNRGRWRCGMGFPFKLDEAEIRVAGSEACAPRSFPHASRKYSKGKAGMSGSGASRAASLACRAGARPYIYRTKFDSGTVSCPLPQSIMGSKWDIEKFTGSNDFGLWKVKVRAILTQQKCDEALKGVTAMPANLSYTEKSEMDGKVLSVIILCHHLVSCRQEDEDQAFHLLCALPKSLEHLKDALLYGKEGTITLDEVQAALRTKELTKLNELKIDDSGEGLNISRGRSENRGKGKGKKHKSKSRAKGDSGGKFKCYHCHEPGALTVTSWEPEKSWVMDSGCSYHICPRKEYFETLELKECGVFRLGNNKVCKVQGTGFIRLKMYDGRNFLLKKDHTVEDFQIAQAQKQETSKCSSTQGRDFQMVKNTGKRFHKCSSTNARDFESYTIRLFTMMHL